MKKLVLSIWACVCLFAPAANAEEAKSGAPETTVQAAAPAKPPPYSLPWGLRPAQPVNVIRSDTSVAFYNTPEGKGTESVASFLLLSAKLHPNLSALVRFGMVGDAHNAAPTNIAVGMTLGFPLHPNVRIAGFLAMAVPFGAGGGNRGSAELLATERSGILARSAMDNAMFAVNDLVIFPGIDIAYVGHGLTVQAEATVLQLNRVRGEALQKDAYKTNFTTGLHVGYFVIPQISIGAELRYQRWLSTPAAVAADPTDESRDNLTIAVGPRFHLQLAKSTWLRPGISYARGFDNPMAKAEYNVLQIDLPLVF